MDNGLSYPNPLFPPNESTCGAKLVQETQNLWLDRPATGAENLFH